MDRLERLGGVGTDAEQLTITLSRGELLKLRHAAELLIDVIAPERSLPLEVSLARIELVLDPVAALTGGLTR
jgi:hypothetical protein